MANKPQPQLIDPAHFGYYLQAWRAANKLPTAQALADKLGISLSAAYNLLAGNEEPSDEIVKQVGLKWVLAMDVPDGEEEPKPGRAKK